MASHRVEIIGAGVVGTATGTALSAWGHETVYKELLPERREQLQHGGERVVSPEEPVEADLTLVAVPTPYDDERERLDMAHVEAAIELLAETASEDRVVGVRSTVLPGTIDRLSDAYGFDHMAMLPEFLFAATAVEDARAVDSLIVGTRSHRARELIEEVYAHNDPTFVHMDPTEAELVKLVSNAYGATKISFANEMWRIVDATEGARRDRVLEVFRAMSPWVETARGLAGGWPYGGACLPKDTSGFQGWLREEDVPAPQLDGTIAENELMLERERETRAYGRW